MKKQVLDLIEINNQVTNLKFEEWKVQEKIHKTTKPNDREENRLYLEEIQEHLDQLREEYGQIIDELAEESGIGMLEFVTGTRVYKDLEHKYRTAVVSLQSGSQKLMKGDAFNIHLHNLGHDQFSKGEYVIESNN